jgi:hypothetical protein
LENSANGAYPTSSSSSGSSSSSRHPRAPQRFLELPLLQGIVVQHLVLCLLQVQLQLVL